DRVSERWVGSMHRAMAHHDMVTGPVLYVDDVRTMPPDEVLERRKPTAPRLYLDQAPFAPSNNFGIRRSLFEAVSGFDVDLRCCQDAELTIRAQANGASLG